MNNNKKLIYVLAVVAVFLTLPLDGIDFLASRLPFQYVYAGGAPVNPVWDQTHFRFRNDDGSETTATWKDLEDTNITGQAKSVNFRIRIETAETAKQNTGTNVTPLIEYKLASGAACADTTGWTTITTATTNAFALSLSSQFVDKAASTNQLTSPGAGANFIAGEILELSNPATAVSGMTKSWTEHEWSMQATTNAADSTAYIFRLSKGTNNTNYNAYTICPQLTTAAAAAVTTIADGTNPGNSTIAPGSAITDLDAFTLVASAGTDTVTAATVTLGPAGAFDNIAQADITNASNVAQCTAITNPGSNTLSFTGCTIPVTTSVVTFKVRITPKTHANMPVPPGASYDTTGTVTAFTSTNTQSGTDGASATITVDNLSPNGVTGTSGSVTSDTSITLNWTTSLASDFSRSVVLRWQAATPGAEVPAEGTDYTNDTAIGTAKVACVRTADAASTAVSGVDGAGTGGCSATALTASTQYSYKHFQKDSNGNYDVGVTNANSPLTTTGAPAPTLTFSLGATSVALGTLSASAVTTGSHTIIVGTNAANGVSVTYSGATLASGANTITAMSTAAASSVGTEQFGINAVANATPSVGAACSGTVPIAAAATGYSTANNFKFVSGETIVSSAGSINDTTCTISYIANITAATEAGSYSATLTYIATGNF